MACYAVISGADPNGMSFPFLIFFLVFFNFLDCLDGCLLGLAISDFKILNKQKLICVILF